MGRVGGGGGDGRRAEQHGRGPQDAQIGARVSHGARSSKHYTCSNERSQVPHASRGAATIYRIS
eukprot:6206709-Prymnesium_polylepis.1